MRYIFREPDGDVSKQVGIADNSMAHFGDITIVDDGNGVTVFIGRKKKPISLDYIQISDLLRCAKMLDRDQKASGGFGLDDYEMYVSADV